jgi:hypothetical protein
MTQPGHADNFPMGVGLYRVDQARGPIVSCTWAGTSCWQTTSSLRGAVGPRDSRRRQLGAGRQERDGRVSSVVRRFDTVLRSECLGTLPSPKTRCLRLREPNRRVPNTEYRTPSTERWHARYSRDSNIARRYSRFMRAMLVIGISFGQTASHSPSFEQLPKPSASWR